jgi:peptidoglycan/LPS O-acetylase OafA/YrhL
MNATPRNAGSLHHIAALDGLRGVAILLVMLRHASEGVGRSSASALVAMPGRVGWVGVDLFLALSGFLITGILLDRLGRPEYFRAFYVRRALRIWPLYAAAVALLMTAALVVLALAGGTPSDPGLAADAQRLIDDGPWYWTHSINLRLALAGVWRPDPWNAAPFNTTHLWSLAVEEQFYLAWPLVIALTPRRRLPALCVVLAAASWALRVALRDAGVAPFSLYVLPVTRLEPIALGAALAALAGSPAAWPRLQAWGRVIATASPLRWADGALLAIAGAYAVAGAGDPITGAAMQTIGYPVIAVLAAACVLAAVSAPPTSGLARVLSHPALQWTGVVSYGLYVVHYPLLYAADHAARSAVGAEPGEGALLVARTAALAVAFVLAGASRRWLEEPFLRFKERVPYAQPAATPRRAAAGQPPLSPA